MGIVEYVREHAVRGECQCGKCVDRGNASHPKGHIADLIFFKVGLQGKPSKEEFVRLSKEHESGYVQTDPLDGKEHSYIELGGWIGDQGLALQYMGIGVLLGIFELLTPRTVLGELPEKAVIQMARSGYVTIKLKKEQTKEVGDGS